MLCRILKKTGFKMGAFMKINPINVLICAATVGFGEPPGNKKEKVIGILFSIIMLSIILTSYWKLADHVTVSRAKKSEIQRIENYGPEVWNK